MGAHTEIERKFLVCGDYKPGVFASSHIVQGYLCLTPGRTVRVRIRDDKGYLTIKGPTRGSGMSRFEWEEEIPLEQAQQMLSLVDKGVIDKTRHLVKNSDGIHTWEVDEFHGENEGLVVAEIELGSEDETFDKPDWLGEEVTGERRYYNSQILLNPYTKW